MQTIDKILGLTVFLVAVPFVLFVNVHFAVTALVAAAALVYALFLITLPKLRCGKCGHYFTMNIWERYVARLSVKRCGGCSTSGRVRTDSDLSTILPGE